MSDAPRIGSLFSGYGGLDLAVEALMGAEVAWYAEWEDAPSAVLARHWPDVPNLRDVTAVDWATVEPVDIITGGFPCQDVSLAGRRAGMAEGTRSNLWAAMREAINIIRPAYVVAENVRGLLNARAASNSDMEPGEGRLGDGGPPNLRALGRVLGDLASIGYDVRWGGLQAADVGAPHRRFRVFILGVRRDPVPHSWGGRRDRGASLLRDGGDPALWRQTFRDPGDGRAPWDHQTDWREYAEAIATWEAVQGPAPSPTVINSKGTPSLSPWFTEWMMGLPPGWINATTGVTRRQALKMTGNGVVPLQAYHALRLLLDD